MEEASWTLRVRQAEARRRMLKSFGNHARGVFVEAKHGRFVVDPEDAGVGARLSITGEYERDILAYLTQFMSQCGDVLVVGAHLGAHVVPFSRRCRRLVAIEANPDIFELLEVNLALNKCDNVSTHRVAASDKDEELPFLASRENSGGAKRRPVSALEAYIYDAPEEILVPARRLDDLLGPDAVFDVVLMDIEGSETFALRGMQGILSRTQVLCVEFVPEHLRHVAGVSVDEFADVVEGHFLCMHVPGLPALVGAREIRSVLRQLYDNNVTADDVYFYKSRPPSLRQLIDHSGPLLYPIGDGDEADPGARVVSLGEQLHASISIGDLDRASQSATELLYYPEEAVQPYVRANALATLGAFNHLHGKKVSALDFYFKALHIAPEIMDWRGRLATICTELHWDYRAKFEIGRALAFAPDNVELRVCQGFVGVNTCDEGLARTGMEEAVRLSERRPDTLLGLAIVEGDVGNWARGYDLCDEVLASCQDEDTLDEARRIKGTFLLRDHRLEEAIDWLSSVRDRPDGETENNMGLGYMLLGDWRTGFRLMEARLKGDLGYMTARFQRPMWDGRGERLRLHVHYEQGTGDTFHFARFAPVLADLGHQVSFEVQSELVSLFRRSLPTVDVLSAAPDHPGTYGLSDFDAHVPLLSAAHLLGVTEDTVPLAGGYVVADEERVRRVRSKLREGLNVGLCWAGSFRPDLGLWTFDCNKRRSIPMKCLEPLLDAHREVNFYSLQVGERASDADGLSIVDPGLRSWEDTAAWMASLDLVISVDTAVAHLAGALGRPTWLLCWRDSMWQWGIVGSTTPWYSSMRIYRQLEAFDWLPIINQVSDDLNAFF